MGIVTNCCPLPAVIPDITDPDCAVHWGQVIKMAFQKPDQNSFADITALQTLATWTALLAANDDTKMQVTPVFSGLVFPISEPILEGENTNDVIGGIADLNGLTTLQLTAQIKGLTDDIALELANYTCFTLNELGSSNLVVYFFTQDGKILHNDLAGFEIFNFCISANSSEGFGAKNIHQISFQFRGDWSYNKQEAILTDSPNFNPITDL